MNFSSSLNSEVAVKFTFYSLKNKTNGNVVTRNLVFTTSNPNQTITLDLSNYELDLTHDGTAPTAYNRTYNHFSIRTETTFKFRAGQTMQRTDKINYTVTLENLKNSLVYGDFGKETFNVKKHLFNIFKDQSGDSETIFANPELNLKATNQYGAEVGINLSKIKGIRNATLSSEDLIYNKNGGNFIIQSATYNGSVVPKITKETVNRTNSNFHTLLSKSDQLEFDLIGELNPNSVSGRANNNFYDNKNGSMDVNISVKIPLELTVKNFKVEKFLKFKRIKNLKSAEEIDLVFLYSK